MKLGKILTMLCLVLALCLLLLPTQAEAAVVDSGTCGDNLTWTLDDTGTLTISGTGAMKEWNKENEVPWRDARNEIKSVVIQKGVTTIGLAAFYNCRNLTAVTIPDGVTTIGNSAFSFCMGLTSVTIPDSVTTIGIKAFYNTSLTTVTIGTGVTGIESGAFGGCFGLTDVYISNPSAWCRIAFGDTTSANPMNYAKQLHILDAKGGEVTELVLDNTVTQIPKYAFRHCTNLTSIIIPDSVTTIEPYAFSGCSNLEHITIPFVGGSRKTSTDANQYPFGYIFGNYTYEGGVAAKQEYIGSSRNTTTTTWYIPDSLKTVTVTGGDILFGAFYNCNNLTSVTLPDGITEIGEAAFYSCKGLTSITIPDSVITIEKSAFYECSNLKDLAIGNSVTNIGYSAFYRCSGLTSVMLSDSVTTIGAQAFYLCKVLQSVALSEHIESIGGSAFAGCNSLTDVYYTQTQAQWDLITIESNNSPLTDATIHYEHIHNYKGEPSVMVDATCLEDGYRETVCVCGKINRETIPALGHTFENGICTGCGIPDRVPGDLDATEGVTTDDVVALLLYISMPDMFSLPEGVSADFTGDGQVTTDDAVTLLLHISMPDMFPLEIKKED